MRYKAAQVIGPNTDQTAAQAISSIRNENNVFAAVIHLSCDDAFTKGRQVLAEIADYFFEEEGSIPDKLNSTFLKAEQLLTQPSNEGLEDSATPVSYDLVLAVVSGKTLYLIYEGQVVAFLKRDGKVSSLLSIGSPKQIISGFLQDDDRILLATADLSQYLESELNKTLDLPLAEWEDELTNKISVGNLDHHGMAGLLLDAIPEQSEISSIAPVGENALQNRQKREFKNPFTGIFTSLKDRIRKNGQQQTEVESGYVLNQRRFSLGRLFPASGRNRLILGLLLLLIIGIGVGLKVKSDQEKARDLQFQLTFQQARDDFSAAQGLQNLNPAEAKSKLESAKSNLTAALNSKPNDGQAQELKSKISEQENVILQQFNTQNLPEFLDLNLIKQGLKSKGMSLSDGKILLLDTDSKTLVSIDISKKSNQVLAGKEKLGDALFVSLNTGSAFAFSSDKGVIKVDINNQKDTVATKPDEEWGKIVDIAGFGSNFYLLDTLSNKIWKYIGTSSGYSDKREYLNEGVKADFTHAIKMQIESSVYVLKQGGEILRFTRGAKDNFALNGLDKNIKDPKSFFVSSDTDNLYILDSGNSRLVIVSKSGDYKGQYAGDKFSVASDLVVDEKSKKVYLLEGFKIYTLDLK
ncbi:hypothetical protein HYW42_01070 [Candidatus Daviesbacteria bacterium]|nr:hypothetical protein [Candidatus Daviesbacteria bacterium]